MLTVTSVEAQNRFGQLLDAVQREPITITRHGRTAAFIVSPQDMSELKNASVKNSKVVEAFDAYFANAKASHSQATAALTDEDLLRLAKKSTMR